MAAHRLTITTTDGNVHTYDTDNALGILNEIRWGAKPDHAGLVHLTEERCSTDREGLYVVARNVASVDVQRLPA